MIIEWISSKMEKKELDRISKELNILFLDPEKINNIEELKLAEYLARKSFKKKKIARKFPLEFLLWLSGKTNIKSAMEMLFKKNSDVLVVSFSGRKIIKKLGTKKPLMIPKRADPLQIEKISLSRI